MLRHGVRTRPGRARLRAKPTVTRAIDFQVSSHILSSGRGSHQQLSRFAPGDARWGHWGASGRGQGTTTRPAVTHSGEALTVRRNSLLSSGFVVLILWWILLKPARNLKWRPSRLTKERPSDSEATAGYRDDRPAAELHLAPSLRRSRRPESTNGEASPRTPLFASPPMEPRPPSGTVPPPPAGMGPNRDLLSQLNFNSSTVC